MNGKNNVRRQSFSSEFRNAFVVRNKCEQLKLEQQHKSLDRLRAHESLNLTNKKREILSLQMSILSSKPDENTQDLSIKPSQPLVDVNGTRRKFRSRTLSTSASSINSFLGGGSGKDSRIAPSSVNSNKGKIYQFKKLSRSFSVSGNLNCFTRRKYTTALQTDDNNNNNEESLSVGNDESSGAGQAIWKLLPPIQLTPLHKQKSKSLKEISLHLETPRRKISMPQENISWNDLHDCRYLRRTWRDRLEDPKGKDASDSEVKIFKM